MCKEAAKICSIKDKSVERIKRTLFDEVQGKVTHLDERIRMVGDQMDGVAKTIDRNEHSKCASITAMIREQKDIRRLVEELAKRLDRLVSAVEVQEDLYEFKDIYIYSHEED